MRKSTAFLSVFAGQILLLCLVSVHAVHRSEAEAPVRAEKSEIVKRLGITDLCLFTEASYTRHLTQADIHTPFQDHPFSLEHFPSGSLLTPPTALKRINGKLD